MVMPMDISPEDRQSLIRDKYNGDSAVDLSDDIARLQAGEPLAYVIGWQPFLGLEIDLSTRPLIPRAETEWWTKEMIAVLSKQFGTEPFSFLDLCSGSGAVGLAVKSALPQAKVTLSDIDPAHATSVQKTIARNPHTDLSVEIVTGDAFSALEGRTFNVIATNPPYVPSDRILPASVSEFEPALALFSGEDGLVLIRTIAEGAAVHLEPGGVLWLESDVSHIEKVRELLQAGGAKESTIHEDLYGRPRYVVSYYP